MARELETYAARELRKSPAELRDFLEERNVIPRSPRLSVQAVARTLTPADARVLIQELARLAARDRSRTAVLHTLGVHASGVPMREQDRELARGMASIA